LEICAGGVHNQLWQKMPVEDTVEIILTALRNEPPKEKRLGCRSSGTRLVDYLPLLGENK
jgi:hypothetical protein